MLRSRSSPDFLKLSPSPITVQNFFKCKVQVQMKSKEFENAAFSQRNCHISFQLSQSNSGPDRKS